MSKPSVYDFTWVRGTNNSFRFQILQNTDTVAYDDVRVSVFKDNGATLAFRASILDATITYDVPTQMFILVPTAAQTRALTETRVDGDPGKNKYEVEVRDGGDERVYLMGTITAIGGLNDDAA